MKLTALIAAGIVAQSSIIGQPPQPQQYSTYLPHIASAPALNNCTQTGKPFTDAVVFGGALVISRQDGAVFRDCQLWFTVPVNAAGEGGLNALATDGARLWGNYVSTAGRIIVADITSGTPTPVADLGVAGPEHNAAGLLYTNGVLLAGVGDNEDAWQAQSATLAGGKVWAIQPQTGEKSIVAKGLRNPWHIGRIGNDIYISDVGESKFEEVNIYRAGANYGWPCYEAFEPRAYDPETCDALIPNAGSVAPVVAYGRDMGRGVVGVAQIGGHMVFADFSGVFRTFDPTKPQIDGQVFRRVDGLVSKLTMAGGVPVVLVFKGGAARAEVWR